jgi:hypothetical protein
MKKYYTLFLVLIIAYAVGFLHGINSGIVEEKIQKTAIDTCYRGYEKLVTDTFGVINIEVEAGGITEAETDFLAKTTLAKLNKWTLVGEKHTENISGIYRIRQIAMRFQD